MTHDLTHEPETEQVCSKCKPDTKPVEMLGEAKKWRTGTDRAGCSVVLREDGYEIASHIEHRNAELIVEAVNSFDALKARVERYEKALKRIVNCHGRDECGFCGSLRIATEALAPPVGEKEK